MDWNITKHFAVCRMQFDIGMHHLLTWQLLGLAIGRPLLPAGGPFHSFFIQAQKTTGIGNIQKLQQAVSALDLKM